MSPRAKFGFVGVIVCVLASRAAGQEAPLKRDVPFVPTPQEVVAKMIELAGIREGDLLYDLGCGDGRIVVAAAKTHGIKAVGIDIDPKRIEESRQLVEKEGVGDLVTIKQGSFFEEDFSDADVVTMYLLPDVNNKLKPQLRQLAPGTRIVSHSFTLSGVKPDQIVKVEMEGGGTRTIYLYTVPLKEE